MRLHPASLLLGAVAVAGLLTLSSASPQMAFNGSPGVIHHAGAHPRQFVRIDEGTPYTVPTARLFVLSGVGTSTLISGGSWMTFSLNGSPIASVLLGNQSGGASGESLIEFPQGIVAQPGDTVEVSAQQGTGATGVLLGYLTDV